MKPAAVFLLHDLSQSRNRQPPATQSTAEFRSLKGGHIVCHFFTHKKLNINNKYKDLSVCMSVPWLHFELIGYLGGDGWQFCHTRTTNLSFNNCCLTPNEAGARLVFKEKKSPIHKQYI